MVSASSLLLPSSLRDLASCVSDGAVRVACTTPSSTLTARTSSSSSSSSSASPSTLSVAVSYRATPQSPTSPPLLLRLTWSHTPLGPPTLSFAGPTASSPAVLLRRRKGTRSLPALALFWDLTAARYAASSPEPVSGFYVVAVADAEVVLAVGDLAAEFVKAKFEGQIPKARSIHAVSRADRVVVAAPPRPGAAATTAVHAARVRFAEGAPEHDVTVGCCCSSSSSSSTRAGAGEHGEEEELWVSVDGKRAVHARRLRWNFRGNQTVFVDGAPVDVLWDLHGWWFRDPPGCAVVMLRARTALESRLWLQEEAQAPAFALLVQAFKTPP
ncbi:uncharacterized protein LOC110429781 [Sorghum bicolor]|uniref:DUF868 domain-containing protein n=1 Tax=Sorghum bicolor TaxID=4558 RepID=A0A1B6PB64_SORBI|nr:uncharacterized protein LOC110429781 [Sorghum bicolor]KXG22966.1 hypothetical protein SORBI_3008G035300 [Sorghum bicolor]|eukprot:XP_021302030.1 uncharacterized protein LOC110429781 [Sorghum bicolor]